MPVRPDGKIDLDAALAWVATTRQCQATFPDRGVNRLARKLVDGRRDIPADSEPEAAPTPGTIPVGSAPGEATATSYAEARAVRESALGELAQLKLATERGQLVEVAVVKRDWVSTLTGLRGRLLAIPARVAATLPHLSQGDVAAIGAEVHQALEELAHADMA